MNRRGFLLGALSAPAVITTPGLLMPVRKLIEPDRTVPVKFTGLIVEKSDDGGVTWREIKAYEYVEFL